MQDETVSQCFVINLLLVSLRNNIMEQDIAVMTILDSHSEEDAKPICGTQG